MKKLIRKIADFIVDKRKFVLIFYIVALIVSVIGIFNVNINYDMSKYLPDSSSVKKGMELMEDEYGKMSSITVMFEGLDEKQQLERQTELENIANVKSVVYIQNDEQYQKDGYSKYTINVSADTYSAEARNVLSEIRNRYGDDIYLSGAVVDNDMMVGTLINELPLIALIAVIVIFAILFLLCDSWIEPFLYMTSIGVAIIINMGTNALLPSVSFMTFAVAALLQMGLSMDYSIMLMNRYGQEMKKYNDPATAMKSALANSFASIMGSSVTTIVGLIALVFMNFKIGKDMGIVLAKGVFISLICIFTVLPMLVVHFDRLMQKTHKKSLRFNMGPVMKGVTKLRFVILPLALVLVAGAFYLKDNMQVSFVKTFDNEEQAKIEDVFGVDNQTVILYKKDENGKNVSDMISELESRDDVGYVQDYSNTIGKEYTYKELAEDMDMDEEQAKMLFRLYRDSKGNNANEKVTMYDLICFLDEQVAENQSFADFMSDEQLAQIKDARKEMDDGKAELENAKTKLSDAEKKLKDGEAEISKNEKKLDDAQKELEDGEKELNEHESEIADSEKLINEKEQELISGEKKLSESEQTISDGEKQIAAAEKEISEKEKTLTDGEAQLKAAEETLSQSETVINQSKARIKSAEEDLAKQEQLLTNSEKQLENAKKQLKQAGMSDEQISAQLGEQEKTLAECKKALQAGKAELNAKKQELAEGEKKLESGKAELSAKKQELAAGRKQLESGKAEIESKKQELAAGRKQLESAKAELTAGRKQLEEGKKQLADGKEQLAQGRAKIKSGKAELADGRKQLEAAKKEIADGKKEYNDGKKEYEDGIALYETPMTADELAEKTDRDISDINDMLKTYRMMQYDVSSDKMSLDTFLDFIISDVITDKTYSSAIDESMLSQVYDGKSQLDVNRELLLGDNYNRMIVSTTCDVEGDETFRSIGGIEAIAKDHLSEYYLIGDSAMGYEMNNGFSDELNFVTIITIIAIFVVVFFTFRSVFNSAILVAVIQGAVYITTAIVALQGYSVNYIALILVQCILMGATIDYGILLICNYEEDRLTLDRKEALISSMNRSIKTILTSSMILIGSCLSITFIMSQKIISQTCTIIACGAAVSVIMVIFVLPAIIYITDRLIVRRISKRK